MGQDKKKRYTRRYTIDDKEVSKDTFDKVFSSFEGGIDKAMAGVDIAMGGVDRAMGHFGERLDKAFEKPDAEVKVGVEELIKKSSAGLVKKTIYSFVTIWFLVFMIGFSIYFIGKAIHGESNTKPETPISTPLEEKPSQGKSNDFKKL